MARVKNKDTTPELALRRALWAAGVRGYRCHLRTLPGRPDIAFGRARIAVFVDGAFWHGHPGKYWRGRSGPYWDAKIARNQDRDRRVNSRLHELGWEVLRLWDFDVLRDPAASVERVLEAMKGRTMQSDEREFRNAVRSIIERGSYPDHTTIRRELGLPTWPQRSGLKGEQTRWRIEEVERAGFDWGASKKAQQLTRR